MESAPSLEQLLAAWEGGRRKPPAQQALALLAACHPESASDALAQFSIGQRDRQLFELRRHVFGSPIIGLASCPDCNEPMELRFHVEDVLIDAAAATESEFSLDCDGYAVRFRLPNSLDAAAAAACNDVPVAKRLLLERCLLDVRRDDEPRGIDELPEVAIAKIAACMAQADPQASVQLALECPGCTHHWHVSFDIASFLWEEVNAWAERLLRDVHRLAMAYGWSESEIFSLPAWRRQRYLDLIGT